MRISFRQGIIEKGDGYLQLDIGQVSLLGETYPFSCTIAHGSSNYTHEENVDAVRWVVDNSNLVKYLVIEIDLLTGEASYISSFFGVYYADEYPSSSAEFEYFFHTIYNKMYKSVQNNWIEVLAIFVGEVDEYGIIEYDVGSQVGINLNTGDYIESSYILHDGDTVVKINNMELATNSTNMLILDNYLHNIKPEINKLYGYAEYFIPEGYCISIFGDNSIKLATNSIDSVACHGISIKQSSSQEINEYIKFGFLTSDNFSFSEDPMTPLFVGESGQPTTVVPQTNMLQKIGYVLSTDTIFVDIQIPILMGVVV